MREEFNALVKQDTWILTPFIYEWECNCKGKSAIVCKWMYKIKKYPDSSVAQYKTILVAKEYNLRVGIDYETFSRVIKKLKLCIILSSCHYGWSCCLLEWYLLGHVPLRLHLNLQMILVNFIILLMLPHTKTLLELSNIWPFRDWIYLFLSIDCRSLWIILLLYIRLLQNVSCIN